MKMDHLLFRVRVRGESLWPELIPGRSYWASNSIKPRIGDYIVFKDPEGNERKIVKKIKHIASEEFDVGGTVPWSSSYRVTEEQVIGTLFHSNPT